MEVLAAIVDAPAAEPRVGSIILPRRGAGTTLLAVQAAPLNPLDLLIASGAFHSARHEDPYVPGSECVGVVLESEAFPIGSVVYAECAASPVNPGSFATRMLVADDSVLVLPDGLDPVRAAAVGNSGVAAFMSLVESARMVAGDTVLILGATGAVGQLAVQIAHARGAGRVVAVGRDYTVLRRLLELGADAIVELRSDESSADLAARLRLSSGPVDVIVDGLYGLPLEAALQVCAPRARVVNVGHSAGATAVIPAGLLRGKQITMVGFAGLHTSLKDKQPALGWLWSALGDGTLQVAVQLIQLEQLPSAWRGQAQSPHAKYVVVPAQPAVEEFDAIEREK